MKRSLIFLLGLFLASPAGAGVRCKAQVTAESELSLNVWLDGDRARLEVDASDDPNLAAHTAILTTDRGETIVVLNPQKQEFFSLSRAAIHKFKQRESERRRLRVDAITTEKLGEDAGPEMLNHATRHLRFRLTVGLHSPSARGEVASRVDVFLHFWLAPDVNVRNTDLAILTDSSSTGIAALDQFLHDQLAEMPGFILKRSLVVSMDDPAGNHHVVRSTYEVKEMAAVETQASLFEVPAGFHVRVPASAENGQQAVPQRPRQ
jgi:hypothetical protein